MNKIDISGIPQLRKAVAFLLTILLTLAPLAVHARTWHAKIGSTMEGELVARKGNSISVKSPAGQIFTFPITNLVEADQKYVAAQAANAVATGAKPVAGAAGKGGSLAVLSSPFSVKGAPITGKGDDRKSSLKVTNNSNKSAKDLVLQMHFLKADGTVGDTVPHSQSGFFGLDGSILRKGKTFTIAVSSFFMEDNTAAMDGLVKEVTFEDGSTWPALPARPAQNGTDPVSGVVAGVMGKGDEAAPAVGCFNYTKKDIQNVAYKILYLDGAGKTLDKTSYGYMSDKSIIAPGKGRLITGGGGPPKGAVSAKVNISSVDFTDGSKWRPSK
jgi:hypothetical protein